MFNVEVINSVQNILGLLTLILLSLQIFSISFNKIKKIQTINSFVIVFVIFLMMLLTTLSRYIFNSDFDPYYMFTDMCGFCGSKYEYYINFLRISFYFSLAIVSLPYLKKSNDFIKKHLNKIPYFNIMVFYMLSLNVINTGPIIKSQIFIFIFWICQVVVGVSIIKKLKDIIKPSL